MANTRAVCPEEAAGAHRDSATTPVVDPLTHDGGVGEVKGTRASRNPPPVQSHVPLSTLVLSRERSPRTLIASCALEPPSRPLTPSLSPSEGERVLALSAVGLAKAEGRERRFMGRAWGNLGHGGSRDAPGSPLPIPPDLTIDLIVISFWYVTADPDLSILTNPGRRDLCKIRTSRVPTKKCKSAP